MNNFEVNWRNDIEHFFFIESMHLQGGNFEKMIEYSRRNPLPKITMKKIFWNFIIILINITDREYTHG